MSIADKLVYLSGTKDAIKDAIEQKGVAVPEETTFREYADKISQISGGGGGPIRPPVPILSTSKFWESAFLNSSDSFTMNYSLPSEGDTVYTVLWYYVNSDPPVTISPSGVLELVGRVSGNTSGEIFSAVEIYKHVHSSEIDYPIVITPAGNGRRQLSYFTIAPVEGYTVGTSVVSTDNVPVESANTINLLPQENTKLIDVLRVVSLGWSLATTTDSVGRWTNVVPRGWTTIANGYNAAGGNSNQARTFTIGTNLPPSGAASDVLVPYTPAQNNDFILCIAIDIYYTPLEP